MEAPRLTAVVVLPTPPFWFATARTLPMRGSKYVAVRSEGHALFVRFRTARSCMRLRRAMKGGRPCRRSPQGPLRRHPGPPRKPLRRGRDLAKDIQAAIAG